MRKVSAKIILKKQTCFHNLELNFCARRISQTHVYSVQQIRVQWMRIGHRESLEKSNVRSKNAARKDKTTFKWWWSFSLSICSAIDTELYLPRRLTHFVTERKQCEVYGECGTVFYLPYGGRKYSKLFSSSLDVCCCSLGSLLCLFVDYYVPLSVCSIRHDVYVAHHN